MQKNVEVRGYSLESTRKRASLTLRSRGVKVLKTWNDFRLAKPFRLAVVNLTVRSGK